MIVDDKNKTIDKDKENKTIDKIEKISAIDYLNIVQEEYKIERGKKQSFENRAGLLLAAIASISVFLFDKIKISTVFSLIKQINFFYILIKLLFSLCIYVISIFITYLIMKKFITPNKSRFSKKKFYEIINGTNVIVMIYTVVLMCLLFWFNLSSNYSFKEILTYIDIYKFLKVMFVISIYISLLSTIYFIKNILMVKRYYNFNINNIGYELIFAERVERMCKIILGYKNIILQHRRLNEKNAIFLKRGLYSFIILIVSIIFYSIL